MGGLCIHFGCDIGGKEDDCPVLHLGNGCLLLGFFTGMTSSSYLVVSSRDVCVGPL